MQFEYDEGIGVKNYWEAGDVIRIYSSTVNGTGIADFILTEGEGTTVGTFISDGLKLMSNGTTYRAKAMSAKKAAETKTTNYSGTYTSNIQKLHTQDGNNNMQFLAENTVLTSTRDFSGVFNDPSKHIEFKISNYSIFAVKFELENEDVAETITLTNEAQSAKPIILGQTNFENITPGQPVTAYFMFDSSTQLKERFVVDIMTTKESTYNYQAVFDNFATNNFTTGYIYIKDVTEDLSNEPGYFIRQLQNQIVYVGKDYTKSLIYLAKNKIKILDTNIATLGLYTEDIRKAFNKRTDMGGDYEMIDVEFPDLTGSFPDGPIDTNGIPSTGCFLDVTTISGINAPNVDATIGKGAFAGCTGLKTVNLPKAKIISTSAFRGAGAEGFTSTDESFENVTTIDQYAFDGSTINYLNFPECTNVYRYGLTNMTEIEILNLPKVTTFGGVAFGVPKDATTKPLTITIGTQLTADITVSYGYSSFNNRFSDDFMPVVLAQYTEFGEKGANAPNPNAGDVTLILGQYVANSGTKENNVPVPTQLKTENPTYGMGGLTSNTHQVTSTVEDPSMGLKIVTVKNVGKCGTSTPTTCTYYVNVAGYDTETPYMRVSETENYADALGPGTTNGKYWWTRGKYRVLYSYLSGTMAGCSTTQTSTCFNVATSLANNGKANQILIAYGGFKSIEIQ